MLLRRRKPPVDGGEPQPTGLVFVDPFEGVFIDKTILLTSLDIFTSGKITTAVIEVANGLRPSVARGLLVEVLGRCGIESQDELTCVNAYADHLIPPDLMLVHGHIVDERSLAFSGWRRYLELAESTADETSTPSQIERSVTTDEAKAQARKMAIGEIGAYVSELYTQAADTQTEHLVAQFQLWQTASQDS